eukprot:SAG11_NODE_3938_length_2142_cov_1.162017_1_plen_46_part_10
MKQFENRTPAANNTADLCFKIAEPAKAVLAAISHSIESEKATTVAR